jgi:hypothetical protein
LMMCIQYFVNGWGCLFTDPFTIPYADSSTASTAKSSRGSIVTRAVAAKEAQAKAQMTRQLEASTSTQDDTTALNGAGNNGGVPSTKMDRYAQRHARRNSRGRPSAKGAKK